jgi:alkylation response protein AidB-like acyl-CoA dehydrogenase
MDLYELTREQRELLSRVKTIAEDILLPVRMECDEKRITPREVINCFKQEGLFGIHIPKEYGGLEMGLFTFCLVIEEIAKVCGGTALALIASLLGSYPILIFGDQKQKNKYLPALAKGENLAAFALTEANGGSDAFGLKTIAVEKGDYYVINGCKQWITNGDIADVLVVIVKTDENKGARGLSAFIIDKNTEGIKVIDKNDKMGVRASATTHILFNQCQVKKENLLKKEGYGAIIAATTLNYSRAGVGAQALGIATGAFSDALKFTAEREQFGNVISSFQAIQHLLAEMATEIEASRALLYNVVQYIDKGSQHFSKLAAMTKLFCSDIAMKTTVNALQIFGGYGYMKDYEIEKRIRDAKITQIYEGTNQIQKNEIAAQLLKELLVKHS